MLTDGAARKYDAARYIGRVGALAVALGIGVAVLSPAPAYAEPDAGSSTGTASDSATADTTPQDQAPADPSNAPQSDSAEVGGGESPPATVPDTTASPEGADEEPTAALPASDPRDGTVQASGGANTIVTTSSGSSGSSGTTTAEADSSTGASGSERSEPPAAVDTDVSAPATFLSAATVSAATAGPSTEEPPESVPAPVQAATGQRATASIAYVSPSTATRVAVRPPDPVTAFVGQVVSLAVGLFSLVVPQTPSVPVDAPFPWVLLAWVRRQFEETVFDESPQIGFGSINTSQLETGVVTGTISSVSPGRDPVALRLVQGPSNGTVSIDPLSGAFTYTPTEALAQSGGLDRFTVAVRDKRPADGFLDLISTIIGGRRDSSSVATVLVSVLPVGDTGDDQTGLNAADLVRLVADGKVRVHADTKGAVRSIDGTFTDYVVRDSTDAATVVNLLARLLGASPDFATATAFTSSGLGFDGSGEPTEVVYRMRPTVNGIPTMSSQVVLVTDKDGAVTGVFSSYDNRINDVDTTSSADVDEESVALAAARAALLSSLAENLDAATTAATLAALTTQSDLVVYDVDPDVAPRLARRVTVYTAVLPADPDADLTEPVSAVPVISRTYYIHANGAQAGAVFAETSDIHEASWWTWVTSTKTVTDLKGKARAITGEYQAATASWRFNDVARKVSTYAASSTRTAPGSMVTKTWWTWWNRSAVSAHANTAVVFDYYRDSLGHLSYDDAGSTVRVSVLPDSYANASWDPNLKILAFGGNYESALDIVGHEFTHGVMDYAVANGGGLIYQNEPGALNEAYADILGALIENKTGSARWLIAEDRKCTSWSGCAIRDMAEPSRYGQPEHYANRYIGTADYGGVHTNSGIFNFAAYKMMTDARTATVSPAAWTQVFYGSLFKLSTNATFEDARAAVLSTAQTLGFTATQQQAIIDAFNSVGISDF